MPNRILRDWTDSEPINSLSWQAEVCFVRLIMKADDFGRFPAGPRFLRSVLFPIRDGLREADISRWIAECEKAGLLRLYTSSDGKPLVEIRKFGQRTRAEKSKYEAPPPDDGHPSVRWQSTDGPLLTETETETETGRERASSTPPPDPDMESCPLLDSGSLGKEDPPPPRPPPKPPGPFAEVRDAFRNGWRERYGEAFPYDHGKHGAMVKSILEYAEGSVEKAIAIIRRFLASEDKFINERRHGLNILRGQMHEFVVDPKPKSVNTSKRQYVDG